MSKIKIDIIDTEPLGYRGAVALYTIRSGDATAIIDAGFPCRQKTLENKLKSKKIKPETIKYVLITHAHLDHMGAAHLISKMAPNAKFVIHVRGERHLLYPVRILAGSKMAFGEEFVRRLGIVNPILKEKIQIAKDMDVIELDGNVRLRIIETPGHTPDHISIYEENNGYLFTGDAVCNYYPQFKVFVPPASPPFYPTGLVIRSIEKLRSLEPRHIYTPHFGRITMKPKKYFDLNIEAVSEWGKTVHQLLDEGKNFIEIVDHFRKMLLEKTGVKPEDLEPYFREIFLPVMIKVSIMGYMGTILNTIR